ncbi:hypothetical protein [Paradevosia shaoguanensis]|uniref:hypothetical protein n=1 Tax=Paradevosia shaoguanensis TaxID=1335043 RepID=UPI003C78036E
MVSEDELAKLIARVALGQSRYAERILKETGFLPPKTADTTLKGAIKLLTAKNPAKPYHRDGWMFQVMSWIASHKQDGTALIREPHMIHAHKGFDGIHVKLDAATKLVTVVVVCEEKATEQPRGMITSKVWPEFKDIEKAERDHQLLSEVITMLRLHPGTDVEQAIEQIVWKNARTYRLAITVGEADDPVATFEGYPGAVTGAIARRRAETLPLADVRAWMVTIADKAIAHTKKLAAENV